MAGVDRPANARQFADDIRGGIGALPAWRNAAAYGMTCAFPLLIGRESRLKHSSHSPVTAAA
jgi:hypothetical protein